MVAEDVKDELYSVDDSHWFDDLECIWKILHFPVNLEFVSGWRNFIYIYSNRLRFLSTEDKNIISECNSIAFYSLNSKFGKIKIFGIKISENKRLRNIRAIEIYKLFRKLYGRYILFSVYSGKEIAFVGTSYDKNEGSETIISDWFGYQSNLEKLDRLEDIDSLNYSNKSIEEFYSDYVWGIARPYVKYRESKMFLTFGCENTVTYDTFAETKDGHSVPVIYINETETFQINSSYYPKLYGEDYFIEDSAKLDDSLDVFNETDKEFEWTMLEMDLAEEIKKSHNMPLENDSDKDSDEEKENRSLDDKFSNMNPKEMLEYIRNK